MSKYSDDEYLEFVPESDSNTTDNHAEQTPNVPNNITFEITMTIPDQHLPADASDENINLFTWDMHPADDSSRFQIDYEIFRDQLPAIVVFHCRGKLIESNCLVLHNTFKMCSTKNLPFIIFDMSGVVAVEKEVWVYFSSKVSKLQKLNGILLFAGIRSEVLSETTDFNKLNICHCDTVATCCLAIRNLIHDHEKTDCSMVFDENDSSVETQSNIHDFLFNEKPKSEPPEMKFIDSLLSKKKNTNIIGHKSDGGNGMVDQGSQHTLSTQPQSPFSPFEKTVLINNDGSDPIAEAKRKVMAELKGDSASGKAEQESQKNSASSDSQPKALHPFSAFDKTVLFNNDGSDPIAEAKRKVMAELKGDGESEMAEQESQKNSASSDSQPKALHPFSAFDKTVLFNNDGSDPIAEAKHKVMVELKGDDESEMAESESQKSIEESNAHSKHQTPSALYPIERVNINNPGLFEKTILINDEDTNAILDIKKKVLEELSESNQNPMDQSTQSNNYVASENKDSGSNQNNTIENIIPVQNQEPLIRRFVNSNDTSDRTDKNVLEKTVLFNEDGTNPIADAKKKVLEERVSEKLQAVNKEKTHSLAGTLSQPISQHQSKSKPVVSDKSQILLLKDLYIDDSMSTDYSILDKKTETQLEDTDGEILPLIDESQSIDFSQNDKTVMSQSATVDISRSSLGLTKTNEQISLKNSMPSDPYSIHYGVYEAKAEEKNHTLSAGKTESGKPTAQELIFKVIADYGPVNILQLKNHINEKLDKKDRINTLKLFALLRQVDLDTHEKRVRFYRSC